MYEFKKVTDSIYVLLFDNCFDLGMHFLRFQEFSECPEENFFKKEFKIIDFIEWYSKKNDNNFTYCTDWAGFNIPSQAFVEVFSRSIEDRNKYDNFMEKIISIIYPEWNLENLKNPKERKKIPKFCIIGALIGDKSTLEHEYAHAFYHTCKEYEEEIAQLIVKNPIFIKHLSDKLLEMGYHKEVLLDECQAYLSTGLTSEQKTYLRKNNISEVAKVSKEFNKVFKKYYKKILKDV